MGVGGSYITVKSNLEPVTPELAGSYYGSNPYQIRNLICMRNDAIAGTIWLGLSLMVMTGGTIVSSIFPTTLLLQDAVVHVFVIMGLGFLSAWATLSFSNAVSRKQYVPRIVKGHRGMFDRCVKDLNNPAKYNDVATDLNQIGTLIDVPRLSNEDNAAFLERLKPFFTNTSPNVES